MTDTPKPGTALPWFADGCLVANRNETRFAAEANSRENAAYIVWACNSAPALMEALAGLALFHESGGHEGDAGEALEAARTALAKAGAS